MTEVQSHAPAEIVGFGEVLLRLSSRAPALLFQDIALDTSFCGAEANVLVAMAGFGHHCRMVTALPANPVGAAAIRAIAQFGVELSVQRRGNARMGLFFLEPGAMGRPSAITYDRAGSAFATTEAASFDWDTLLPSRGWLYLSGITAALGDEPLSAMRAAIASAKARGLSVAFDTNFRPALWRGREQEAALILRELACEADLVFAGRRAVAMMAGGTYDHADPDEGFHAAARHLFGLAPRLAHVAATRRTVFSTDRQDMVGLLADRAGLSVSRAIVLENIADRVGTGDAYAAGVLHSIVRGWGRQKSVDFAAACSQWAHSVPGDFIRATTAEVEMLMSGSSDVSR